MLHVIAMEEIFQRYYSVIIIITIQVISMTLYVTSYLCIGEFQVR